MKLSVAMCTYNGAKYIREQLDSILNQTLPVDEIIICDDGSTDDTHNIIRQYVEKYPGVISLHVSKENLGVCANFDKAIHLCTGDIIFLADQDDIWHEDKTSVVIEYLKQHSKKDVVFTNATLVDDKGRPRTEVPKTLFESYIFTRGARLLFDMGFELDLILKSYRTTGCTMAMKKDFVTLLNIDSTIAKEPFMPIHDAQIGLEATRIHGLGYIKECLMDYRIHPEQQISAMLNKYSLNNNIFTDFTYPGLLVMLKWEKLSTDLRQQCYFIKKRVDKEMSMKDVVALIPLYIRHYRWLFLLPLIFDMKKSVLKGRMFSRL